MRYALISKGLSLSQIETEARKAGAQGIRTTRLLNQVFCELDAPQAEKLARISGLKVKPLKEYKTDQVVTETPQVETLSDVFYLLRSNFTPPLTGAGLTVAVLDSGVRKTHRSLKSKVVYEANFTESATAEDIFGHGTQVAFIVAGGMHALGEKAGVSPGAAVMNIKVINDEGIGSDESIILGIDKVCDLADEARRSGLWPSDDMYPNVINLSLGGEDDGDEDNPVRAACREASTEYGLDVIAAAGNSGSDLPTYPAYYENCLAVAASDQDGQLAPLSNYGDWVDVLAPGFNIYSTLPGNEYGYKSGTSFACAYVSGMAALIFDVVNDVNCNGKLNDEVRLAIESGCKEAVLTALHNN